MERRRRANEREQARALARECATKADKKNRRLANDMPREAPLSNSDTTSSVSPLGRRPEPAQTAPYVPAGARAPQFYRAAPRRYTGFAGLGAAEVAPDVILFTPRRTPPSAQYAAPVIRDTPSPVRRASMGFGETPEEERVCKRSWALCAAAMAPVLFSTWMLLLPFMFRSNVTIVQLPPLPPAGADSPRVPTAATAAPPPNPLPPLPKSTPTKGTTQSPKSTTPSKDSCIDPPVIADITGAFNSSVYKPSAFLNSTSPSELICLFNNTRLSDGTGATRHYSVQSLPYQICSKLVYWSVGIENGKIKSRTPVFDQLYGLQQLRRTTDHLGYTGIKILVTVGGYGSDTPHFTKAGSDPAMLGKLTNSVLEAVSAYRLDGLALHWVQPRPECQSGGDRVSFVRVVLGFHWAFARSTVQSEGIIAVITDNDRISADYSRKVANVVKYFFVFAYRIPPRLPDPYRLCELFTEQTNSTLREFTRNGTDPGIKASSLCIIESLAPITVAGVWDSTTGRVQMPEDGLLYGRTPFHAACNEQSFCKDNRSHSCILQRAGGDKNHVTFYAISSLAQYHDRFSLDALGVGTGDVCVLITDFDYDNYDGTCNVPFVRYVLVRNLYYGSRSRVQPSQYGLYRNPDCDLFSK
ncbi:uncharacterized protein LOC119402103 [Rhipicephalus sanguineus]|uniref:GH18 domain-containing protein n=1 Tax=Rhipicephalus sanguineus TaxID=34632 RepID=A0A9D4PFS6_RHISA|nr:uncharacterized protein LOC119402103 [Rhipicephalus sanguineus]KAH7940091.1 hypothetical protein HPB52_021171 [Rhipicephalus sanguineus]